MVVIKTDCEISLTMNRLGAKSASTGASVAMGSGRWASIYQDRIWKRAPRYSGLSETARCTSPSPSLSTHTSSPTRTSPGSTTQPKTDRTAIMADLADLRDCHCGRAHLYDGSERHFLDVDALRRDVLGEIAVTHVKAVIDCNLDGFFGQERDLSMPVSRMRIPLDAEICRKPDDARFHRSFAHSLLRRRVHGNGQMRTAGAARRTHAVLEGSSGSGSRVP